jgi:drug/metabolite transporter (DMT)-like permease
MWFTLALLSALFQVLRNMAMKRLGHALDETINVWGRFTFLLPFAALGVAFKGVPPVHAGFWALAAAFGVVQSLGTLSLSKALKVADISLVTALWKISVLILVVWGYLVLGERPSALGLAGVLVSVTGVYLLNVHRSRISVWAPLASLVQDAGQRWTVLAGIGYAVAVVLIKQMALLSDPVFAVLIGYVFCSAFITPYALVTSAAHFRQVGRYWKSFVGMGAAGTLSTWFGTTAYTMTVSAYVEAVKQVEILLALAIGYLIFQEGARIRLIWAGTVVIMVGMVLLKLGD